MFAVCQDMRGITEERLREGERRARGRGGPHRAALPRSRPGRGRLRIIDTWTTREAAQRLLGRPISTAGGPARPRQPRPRRWGRVFQWLEVGSQPAHAGRRVSAAAEAGLRPAELKPARPTPSTDPAAAPRYRPEGPPRNARRPEEGGRHHDPGRPLPHGDDTDLGHPGRAGPSLEVFLEQHEGRRRGAERGSARRPAQQRQHEEQVPHPVGQRRRGRRPRTRRGR